MESTQPPVADLIVEHAAELLVCPPDGDGLGIIEDGSLAARDGRLSWVGPASELDAHAARDERTTVLSARGKLVMPGIVECHTHLVFGGSRAREYQQRVSGASYQEVAAAGGGIMSTVYATRAAGDDELRARGREHLRVFVRHGVTTLEAKSGYGLSVEDEVRLLRVCAQLDGQQPVDIVPTLLGAHVVAPEYRGTPERYVDLIVEEMIPRVASQKLARFCDVFCEEGAFSVGQSRRVLQAGLEHGLRPKLHADQFNAAGGAQLAAELGAVSADHLDNVDDAGLAALAAAGVTAVLIPGAVAFLGLTEYAPARRFLAAGVHVALSTDFNPGTCTCRDPFIVATLASSYMKMTAAEVIRGITCEAARALALERHVGTLSAGCQADLLILGLAHHDEIPYSFGSERVETVVKAGAVVHEAADRREY